MKTPGLTLMELIVTLLIIGILTSVSLISYEQLWLRYQVWIAGNDLKTLLESYRMRSILGNRTYQVKLSSKILWVRNQKKKQWNSWEKIYLDQSVEYSMKGYVFFYKTGFATPKTLIVGNRKFQNSLIINLNGRIRTHLSE